MEKERDSKTLRYHFVEHWGVNTIANQQGIHHSTVDRALSRAGMPKAERARRPSIADPYTPFILETLAQYPKPTAARLYAMVVELGFTGGASHLRAHVAQLRPLSPTPPRPTCDCAPCPAKRGRSTGRTSARSLLAGRPVRSWPS